MPSIMVYGYLEEVRGGVYAWDTHGDVWCLFIECVFHTSSKMVKS